MESKIRKLLEQAIESAGYILDEVKYSKDGSVNNLMIVIDKDGIVDVNDCVNVSNIINPILDENDPIEESYVLDVCSKEKGCE